MTDQYMEFRKTFYDSIQGDPSLGFDVYFDGHFHHWTNIADKSSKKIMNVFVGDPYYENYANQIVYIDLDYDASNYEEDRGF